MFIAHNGSPVGRHKKRKKEGREVMLGVMVRMCLLYKEAEAGIQQGCGPAVKSEESLDRKGCWFLACILQWAVV